MTVSEITAFPAQVENDHKARLGDPVRLGSLQASGLLDTAPEEAFDRVLRLASHLLGRPVSLLSLVDDQRQFFKAQTGLPNEIAIAQETKLSHSFCQYVVSQDQALAVSDARTHPLLKDNGAVPDLNVIAYLGVPVHAPNGQPLGSFCAIDDKPHDWTAQELSLLKDLAAIIESEIALRDEARRRQLLVRELGHRVKNLFAVMSGMITMTGRKTETVQEMAKALNGRVLALSKAHDLIRPAVTQEEALHDEVSLFALVTALIEPHLTHAQEHLSIYGPTLSLQSSGATHLALVLHEMTTNAVKYGALSVEAGRLQITWSIEGQVFRLTWTETGGPPVHEAPRSSGFGSQLIASTVEGTLGGRVQSSWKPSGVVHKLELPLPRLTG